MKGYEEILAGIESLGIVDEETNTKFARATQEKALNGTLTMEEANFLSPEHVDNRAFWKIIDEKFNHSVMGKGGLPGPLKEKDIPLINRRNLFLAHQTGVLACVPLVRSETEHNVLEIGSGYGNVRDYVKGCIPFANYIGVDVNPKIPEAVEANPDGTMPSVVKDREYDHIICTNVFQHLTRGQVMSYISNSYGLLRKGGMFSFNFSPAKVVNDCVVHYGQITLLPDKEVIIGYCKIQGFVEFSRTVRSDGFIGMNFQKMV